MSPAAIINQYKHLWPVHSTISDWWKSAWDLFECCFKATYLLLPLLLFIFWLVTELHQTCHYQNIKQITVVIHESTHGPFFIVSFLFFFFFFFFLFFFWNLQNLFCWGLLVVYLCLVTKLSFHQTFQPNIWPKHSTFHIFDQWKSS